MLNNISQHDKTLMQLERFYNELIFCYQEDFLDESTRHDVLCQVLNLKLKLLTKASNEVLKQTDS